ncbi:MAG: transporter substrate-binding domain-containing protein, partial [Rhizobiaceae bacterium]|nr:transporter substrate-binding domain-containing protein [Rhizobiaceae bacterium]
TTTDFPPFNYIDAQGRLTGFHVDLARAICKRLEVATKCQIQALPWDELADALAKGDGEAILAGIAVSAESRERYAFSRPYLQFPGRFVMLKEKAVGEPLDRKLQGERVGVLAGSAHERMLRDHFPQVIAVPFEDQQAMLADLKAGKTTAAFGDGMRLGFWLTGSEAAGCCRFAGGPYLDTDYFGVGLTIAARKDDAEMVAAFNYALQAMSQDGGFEELYLRYFPLSFF